MENDFISIKFYPPDSLSPEQQAELFVHGITPKDLPHLTCIQVTSKGEGNQHFLMPFELYEMARGVYYALVGTYMVGVRAGCSNRQEPSQCLTNSLQKVLDHPTQQTTEQQQSLEREGNRQVSQEGVGKIVPA